jgi:hypothetical protein
VLHLVGETALAPEVDIAALRALRLDELEPPLDGARIVSSSRSASMMTMTSYGRTVWSHQYLL